MPSASRFLVSASLSGFLLVAPVVALDAAPSEREPQASVVECAGQDLPGLLKKWQTRLRLQDWEIEIECGMTPELWKTNYGVSATNVAARKSKILVHPLIKDAALVNEVVLHELLHVMLFNVKEARSESVDEQVVQALSAALIETERSQKKRGLFRGR